MIPANPIAAIDIAQQAWATLSLREKRRWMKAHREGLDPVPVIQNHVLDEANALQRDLSAFMARCSENLRQAAEASQRIERAIKGVAYFEGLLTQIADLEQASIEHEHITHVLIQENQALKERLDVITRKKAELSTILNTLKGHVENRKRQQHALEGILTKCGAKVCDPKGRLVKAKPISHRNIGGGMRV